MLGIITDSNGHYKPIVFLIISMLLLLFFMYKKPKLFWVSIIPVLVIPIYSNYTFEVMQTSKQIDFLVKTMDEVYQLQPWDISEASDDDFDKFHFTTSNGKYTALFNKGKISGYEIRENSTMSEDLVARKNVIDTMNTLGVDGYLERVDGSTYTYDDGSSLYSIKINERSRVETVVDEHESILYRNEEDTDVNDGRILEDEEDKY